MTNQQLSNNLRSLLGMLELQQDSDLYQDVVAVSNFLEATHFRIAVFAPFNHGKSTLLNALLGGKTLPIDLIPTTGAVIQIRYGETLQTAITLNNGEIITDEGTKILKQYAILDRDLARSEALRDRILNQDIKQVIVNCNHALLKTGAELIDLPGTNDREEQDKLIKSSLLTANLVIQVLDARKLMTLGEREQLKNWLQDRGINSVIFVLNFLNLLTTEEQQEVQRRMEVITETISLNLPPGIKKVYRVDALPALRAKLKANDVEIYNSGLSDFELALQQIIGSQKNIHNKDLSQVKHLALNILKYAQAKQSEIQEKINLEQEKQQKQISIKQKAEKLIKQGLQRSISELESWLYLPNLLAQEQVELTIALQQSRFQEWQEKFKLKVSQYQQSIQEWIDKSQEFYVEGNLAALLIDYPIAPEIKIDSSSTNNNEPNFTQDNPLDWQNFKIPQEINYFVKKVASNHANTFLNKIVSPNKDNETSMKTSKKSQLYIDAANNYLAQFSEQAFASLKTYQKQAEQFTNYKPTNTFDKDKTIAEHQLQLVENLIDNIKYELNMS